MEKVRFDLQLFAEEAPAQAQPEGTEPPEGQEPAQEQGAGQMGVGMYLLPNSVTAKQFLLTHKTQRLTLQSI